MTIPVLQNIVTERLMYLKIRSIIGDEHETL
jgi:hypothetical protein